MEKKMNNENDLRVMNAELEKQLAKQGVTIVLLTRYALVKVAEEPDKFTPEEVAEVHRLAQKYNVSINN